MACEYVASGITLNKVLQDSKWKNFSSKQKNALQFVILIPSF